MVFNSLHFVVFFAGVYALYRVLPHRAQNVMLLAASYYFYGAWDWRFLGLLLGASTIIDYTCARAIARTEDAAPPAGVAAAQPRVQPRDAGLLQVLQLLRREPARRSSRCSGWHLDIVTAAHRPADRDLASTRS